MVLTTDRLLLRSFLESDLRAIHKWTSDPEVALYMPHEPLTEEQTHDTLQWMIRGPQDEPPHYDFAVVSQVGGQVIGWCGLSIRYDEVRQGEIAFSFNRHYWGKGYATEAAHAVLHHGFSNMQLHRIFATSRPGNFGSIHVLEKLGMRREGHLVQHRWMKGAWHDSFLYAILDHQWQAARAVTDSFKSASSRKDKRSNSS